MAAYIGWVDFSPNVTNKVKHFLDIMGMGGVVDELGIGMIRDSMSNKMFPGMSTLYTRAKYFFITPYILLLHKYSDKVIKPDGSIGIACNNGVEFFNKMEINANQAIINYFKRTGITNESYFGSRRKNPNLMRQPSSIYWSGIKKFNLIRTSENLDQILINPHSLIDDLIATSEIENSEDETKETGELFGQSKVTVNYDEQWMKNLLEYGVRLTQNEAQILRERMTSEEFKDSLICQLLKNEQLWKIYSSVESPNGSVLGNRFTTFVQQVLENKGIVSQELEDTLIRAYNLAIFLYGQHAVYNLGLRKKKGMSDESYYKDIANRWYKNLEQNIIDWDSFDIKSYIESGVNIPGYTWNFLTLQQDLLKKRKQWEEIEDDFIELVRKQEYNNKGKKSRFYKIDNNQNIGDLQENKWLGLDLLQYRYFACKQIVNDIYNPLC